MVEFLKEMLIVLGRIITILPLLLFITIFMGKRAIGQLPIFDFLIIVTLGAVVGADIADPSIKHLPTAVAIIGLGVLQRVVANWKISNRKIGRFITFEPTVIIQDGKLLNKNLKSIRYSIDNILQMLREKNVFDMNEVETAIIESNGSLSVLKKPQKNTVTLEDMNIVKTTSTISYPVIVEGTIYSEILNEFSLNEAWINQQLSDQGIHNIKDVFFASINNSHALHITLKDERGLTIPPIKH
ncbi:DUF421 domain-containing protein [Oceanobacillus manasiensis]|uniref:DUF421 domain-containing protein n=1 Tax=Oceanobacillus manasiensis TaxID=586413 RepID=UPI0005A86731|nr:DUF421 domain-containing protein [Oceanobacillus manasiensis]